MVNATLGCFTPGTETRLPLYRWLGRHQSQSGRERKISPPLGFHLRTVQPVASHYTDCAILTYRYPHILLKLICIFRPLLGFPNEFLPSRGFLPSRPISAILTLWWVCIKLCEGYYHWDHLSSFCHRLLNLPDTQGTTQHWQCRAEFWASGRRTSRTKNPLYFPVKMLNSGFIIFLYVCSDTVSTLLLKDHIFECHILQARAFVNSSQR